MTCTKHTFFSAFSTAKKEKKDERETAGQQDSRTAGQQDSRTAGQQDSGTAGQQDSRTAGQQDSRTAGQQDSRTAGQQDSGTAGQQNCTEGRMCICINDIPMPQNVHCCPAWWSVSQIDPNFQIIYTAIRCVTEINCCCSGISSRSDR
jgi:hypothetical protein